MKLNQLGRTGMQVSALSFGASALGGVFGHVDEEEGIRAVHTALELGINYFDVSPAYGATRSEIVLGRALKGVPRDRYFLSTKVGKYSLPGRYGEDTLDYSRSRIRASLEESAARLGVDYFDIIHIHDIEYRGRSSTEQALGEGLEAVHELKREGRIGAVGFGLYPIDLCQRILSEFAVDVVLLHNQYWLNSMRLLELMPLFERKGVGVINGAPFGSGLLTENEPADWHPASRADRQLLKEAASFCRSSGVPISKLALQFASQNPAIPTTMFSCSSPELVRRNVQWHEESCDLDLVLKVQRMIAPVMNKQWDYDAAVDRLKLGVHPGESFTSTTNSVGQSFQGRSMV